MLIQCLNTNIQSFPTQHSQLHSFLVLVQDGLNLFAQLTDLAILTIALLRYLALQIPHRHNHQADPIVILRTIAVLAQLYQPIQKLKRYYVQLVVLKAEMVVADLEQLRVHEDLISQALLSVVHQIGEHICDFLLQLVSALAAEQHTQDGHQIVVLNDMRRGQLMACHVGYQPTHIPPQLKVIHGQQILKVGEDIPFDHADRILVLFSNYIAQNSHAVFTNVDVFQLQRLDDGRQYVLLFCDRRYDFVVFIVAQLIERLEDDLVVVFEEWEEPLYRDLLLVDVVDEHPELLPVVLHHLQNIRLLAYYLIASSYRPYLPYILRIGLQVHREVLLELFHHQLVILVLLLLQGGQDKQRFVDHMSFQSSLLPVPRAVDGLALPAVEGDGEGSEWREGVGDGIVNGLDDVLFGFVRVVLKIVQAVDIGSVFLEDVGARYESKVLGIFSQFILDG